MLGGWARQEGRTEEREYAYLVLGARRPRRPGDGPETWRMAAAGAQTSSGERESAHARVVSRERRREGGDWKFEICLLLDAGPGENQLRFWGALLFLRGFWGCFTFF